MSALAACERTRFFSSDELRQWLLTTDPLISSTILRVISQLDLIIPKKFSTLFEIFKRYSKKNIKKTVVSHFYEGNFYQDVVQHLPHDQQLQLYLQHFFAILLERFRQAKTTVLEVEEVESELQLFMPLYGSSRQNLVELNDRALDHAQQSNDTAAARRFALEKKQSESLVQRVMELIIQTLSVEQLSALINHNQNTFKSTIAIEDFNNWLTTHGLHLSIEEKKTGLSITLEQAITFLVNNGISIHNILQFLTSIPASEAICSDLLNDLGFKETAITTSSSLKIWINLEVGQKIWLGPAYYSAMPQSPVHGLFSVNQIEQMAYLTEGKFVVLRFHTLSQMSHQENQQIVNQLLGIEASQLSEQKTKEELEENLMNHSIAVECFIPADQILTELTEPFQKKSRLSQWIGQFINTETLTHSMSPTLLELAKLWIKILEFENSLTESLTPKQNRRLEIFWDAVINPTTRIISYLDQRQAEIIFRVYTDSEKIKSKRQFIKAIKQGLRNYDKPVILESLTSVEKIIAGTLGVRLAGASQIGQSVRMLNMLIPCPSFQSFGNLLNINTPNGLSSLIPNVEEAQRLFDNNICPCGQKFVGGICHACGLMKNKFQQSIAQKRQQLHAGSDSTSMMSKTRSKRNVGKTTSRQKKRQSYYRRTMGLGDFIFSFVT